MKTRNTHDIIKKLSDTFDKRTILLNKTEIENTIVDFDQAIHTYKKAPQVTFKKIRNTIKKIASNLHNGVKNINKFAEINWEIYYLPILDIKQIILTLSQKHLCSLSRWIFICKLTLQSIRFFKKDLFNPDRIISRQLQQIFELTERLKIKSIEKIGAGRGNKSQTLLFANIITDFNLKKLRKYYLLYRKWKKNSEQKNNFSFEPIDDLISVVKNENLEQKLLEEYPHKLQVICNKKDETNFFNEEINRFSSVEIGLKKGLQGLKKCLTINWRELNPFSPNITQISNHNYLLNLEEEIDLLKKCIFICQSTIKRIKDLKKAIKQAPLQQILEASEQAKKLGIKSMGKLSAGRGNRCPHLDYISKTTGLSVQQVRRYKYRKYKQKQ